MAVYYTRTCKLPTTYYTYPKHVSKYDIYSTLLHILMTDTLSTVTDIDTMEIARTVACDSSELFNHVNINKSDLTIISQNIRSIYCNFDDFVLNLSTLKFETDVIVLSECRLSTSKPIPQLTNYLSYSTARQINQNDGVVVYVKQSLSHKVKELEISQASCLQVNLLNNTILCIYRSPSFTNTDSFVNSLSTHLHNLNTHKNITITGDININIQLEKQNHLMSKKIEIVIWICYHCTVYFQDTHYQLVKGIVWITSC